MGTSTGEEGGRGGVRGEGGGRRPRAGGGGRGRRPVRRGGEGRGGKTAELAAPLETVNCLFCFLLLFIISSGFHVCIVTKPVLLLAD